MVVLKNKILIIIFFVSISGASEFFFKEAENLLLSEIDEGSAIASKSWDLARLKNFELSYVYLTLYYNSNSEDRVALQKAHEKWLRFRKDATDEVIESIERNLSLDGTSKFLSKNNYSELFFKKAENLLLSEIDEGSAIASRSWDLARLKNFELSYLYLTLYYSSNSEDRVALQKAHEKWLRFGKGTIDEVLKSMEDNLALSGASEFLSKNNYSEFFFKEAENLLLSEIDEGSSIASKSWDLARMKSFQLSYVYLTLYYNSNSEDRVALQKAHEKWFRFRKDTIDEVLKSMEGNLALLDQAAIYIHVTKERLLELKSKLTKTTKRKDGL